MTLQEEKALEQHFVMPTFARKDVEFVSGDGMYLQDSEGNAYLDFLSGIGVCSLGHCHPAVVGAITSQAAELIHVSNYFYIENRGEVAENLSFLLNAGSGKAGVTPLEWKTFFANSGAEANECAIKLARLYAKNRFANEGRPPQLAPSIIVTLVRGFHGRTLASLAATGQQALHRGFEPIPEGFMATPINDIESLRNLFASMGQSICAVMFECVQGESGVNLCDIEFVREIRRLCYESQALMICDEVQCGVFRTGRPFAFQHYGVMPDIVTTAKGIASGMPCAACSAIAPIADNMHPGMHGSTFGGSNLAMAAALATLETLKDPDFSTSIQNVGAYFLERLNTIPQVSSARGLGLMCAADLKDGINATDVVNTALSNGLVINATGPSTLRFLPPLICSTEDVDICIEKLAEVLEQLDPQENSLE